jgi:PAS domain S-box-containing protein
MKKIGHLKYSPFVLAFTAILLIFLFIVISVIISHHHEMMEKIHEDTQRELKLIGNFARDALLRQDYSAVENLLNRWTEGNEEIIEFRATAPNNFVLFDFRRTSVPAHSFHLSESVTYEGRDLILLEMVKDMSPAQTSMVTLRFRLIVGSIVITLILGIVLWFVMRKLALVPMEKEIVMKEQAENKFRMLLESAPDSIIYSDVNGTILMVNEETEKLFGYKRKELEGKDVEVLMPERYQDRHRHFREKFLGSAHIRPMGQVLEINGSTREGREFPADISVRTIETGEGLFFLSSIRDVTERKIAEEKIKRSYTFQRTINKILRISLEPIPLEDQLKRILDIILSIPALSFESKGSIYIMSEDLNSMSLAAQHGFPESKAPEHPVLPLTYATCNSTTENRKITFVNCTNREDGKNGACPYSSPHSHCCVPIVAGDRNLGTIDLIVQYDHQKSRDEEDFLSSVANTVAGIIEHSETNRDRQKLQEELAHAEKMSALGRLTANVAHEIRNPLTLIGGFARKLSRNIHEGVKDREHSGIIISEVNRLEKILKNVLTFSRESKLNKAEHNMNDILEEVIKTYQNECMKKAIQINRKFRDLPPISVDKDQVWIVFNNLFANALDSMPEGGDLTVATEKDFAYGKDYLVVIVSDTGEGIPEEQRKAIFEPFFSTKVIGRGTGLGLSITKKIVEDHEGRIKVVSNVDGGTTFSVYFPMTE